MDSTLLLREVATCFLPASCIWRKYLTSDGDGWCRCSVPRLSRYNLFSFLKLYSNSNVCFLDIAVMF